MWSTFMYVFNVPTSSARSVNSSGLPDRHLWASFWTFRPSYFEFAHALVKVSNLKGTLVVNLCEFSQTFRETLSIPLTEVCHDVLYEAVSMFLLVRQQLQRINQIAAKALRYCIRFEDLGLIYTFTCLYNQEPVWLLPILFFSTNCAPPLHMFSPRDPPNVVFQKETVTMRTQVGHCNASLSSGWRNDFLQNVHLFCLVLCYLLKGLFNSVKGPFRGLHFSSEGVLIFFPIFGSLQSVSSQLFSCSKYSLAGDSWTLNSCLLFFVSQLSKPLYSASFLEKVFHIPRKYGSFPIIFHILPRYAFFPTTCLNFMFPLRWSDFVDICWPFRLDAMSAAYSCVRVTAGCGRPSSVQTRGR